MPVCYLKHVGVELVLDEAGLILGLGHGDEVEGLVEGLLTQQLVLKKLVKLFLTTEKQTLTTLRIKAQKKRT